jgi:putative NADH-flavin reductase
MDHEILVKECQKILTALTQQRYHIAVFMLKAVEADLNAWNLIISTVEYDQISTKTAVRQVVHLLKTIVKQSVLQRIVRVTILKTTDPFIEEMTQLYPVTPSSIRYLQSSFMGDIYLEKAIVLVSQVVSSPIRSQHRVDDMVPAR